VGSANAKLNNEVQRSDLEELRSHAGDVTHLNRPVTTVSDGMRHGK
jgi:hypothetical protein